MQAFIKPLLRVASAALALAALTAPAVQANTTQDTPPNWDDHCRCYRQVSYGPTSWYEPTTRKMARQVMDIFVPPGTPPAGGWPVAYYGHPNGSTHFIAMDTNPDSKWSTLVRPLLEQGYVVVSYEFRHPVVNYVAGSPTPRYDIQKAINTFVSRHAEALNADPTNSFISGQSRGGGLGILTALTGKLTGTTVRAMWTYQAQTTFNCNEMANTFVIPSERDAFLSRCTAVPDAGSSLQSVTASAPPIVAAYDRPFNMVQVPASQVDVHYPDFGYELCRRYATEGKQCDGRQSVTNASAWIGMADFFSTQVQ